MLTVLKEGGLANIRTQEILLEKEEDFQNLPNTIPEGSVAYCLTDHGMVAKMKDLDGTWKNI